MKYFKIVLLFLFYGFTSNALHAQIYNAVKGRSHVLYIGVDNSLDYILKRYDTSVVDFNVSSGTLSRYFRYNEMIWKDCEQEGDSLVVEVYHRKSLETIDTITIRLSPLPDPSIIIPSGQHNLVWGKKELFENKVVASFNSPRFKFKCEILSFYIQLVKQNGILKEYMNPGEKYTDEAVTLMKQFEKGDTAYFNDFKVKCGCEETVRTLGDKLKFARVGDIIKVERE